MRRQLAEGALSMSVEKLDARAAEAFARRHVDLQHGDDEAARLFVSGDA